MSQVADLAALETDEEPRFAVRSRQLEAANADRAQLGLPPLTDGEREDPPELEMYRRARALGLRRISR